MLVGSEGIKKETDKNKKGMSFERKDHWREGRKKSPIEVWKKVMKECKKEV